MDFFCIFLDDYSIHFRFSLVILQPNTITMKTMNVCRTFLLLLSLFCSSATVCRAQGQVNVHSGAFGGQWNFPIAIDGIEGITLADDLQELRFDVGDGLSVPFSLQEVDSLSFEEEPDALSGNKYQVFQLYIATRNGREITSRDTYQDCFLTLNGQGAFPHFSAPAQIRGRGNSSFLWYDKKPLRVKLQQKQPLLGLAKAKSWVLLANYRDVTDLMNTFVFETGRFLGLPFTNHTRYVELFVNGDYRGLYQLTEQIQQNKNRVNVSDSRGILISLDVDDGPGENPGAADNCWSKVYRMPLCVKYPDDEHFTANTVDSVRQVFAQLEQAIKAQDYGLVKQLLDVPSFIKYLQLQEFVYNVELSAPRSIYLHKDGDGPWVMGPLWDFDGGYDFDWGNMYTGHTFFADYRETVMGTNPLKRNGNYNYVPQFFTDLFGCPEFVEEYKAHWASVKDSIVSHGWNECLRYVEQLRASGAVSREAQRWPLGDKRFDTEVNRMGRWLKNRADFMTDLIANIPVPDTTTVSGSRLCGTVVSEVTMDWFAGYDQANKVHVDKSEVLALMGIAAADFSDAKAQLVPLNVDGSEGSNNTQGAYGGWFGPDGNLLNWPAGHVFIEVYSDLWNWNCGLNNSSCFDDSHTATMQLQYPHGGTLLKVNIEIHFTITNNYYW